MPVTTATLTSGQVMDGAAALLNDTAKSIYSYPKQIPYLNIALQDLQEIFELNEVPVTDTVSTVMQVDAGINHIGFAPQGTLRLPSDLIEPQVLWERERDINPFTPMSRLDYLPRYMEGIEVNQFIYFVWQAQEIRFLPADQDNDIKMDYIRNLFFEVTDENENLNVINAENYLKFRTAALCAEFIGENKTRADDLNGFATISQDRALGIASKGRQAIMTRRRPFRSSYKRRTYS